MEELKGYSRAIQVEPLACLESLVSAMVHLLRSILVELHRVRSTLGLGNLVALDIRINLDPVAVPSNYVAWGSDHHKVQASFHTESLP
jgi:hypothetical protein